MRRWLRPVAETELLQCRLLERANNRFRRAAWSLRVAAIFRMIRKSRISIAKAQRQLEEEIAHHAVVIVVVDAVAVPVVVVAGDVADVEVAVVGAVDTAADMVGMEAVVAATSSPPN